MSTPSVLLASFGGGCFWCLEGAFSQLQGVVSVTSGYAGGHVDKPSYDEVCAGSTGHAEIVRIAFDPQIISYDELLTGFFSIHDPTTRDRQGHDIGSQYRSVVFAHGDEQQAHALAVIASLERQAIWPDPIVTEVIAVSPELTFWPAEDYHQNYFATNPYQPYCQAVVGPKVAKLRRLFASKLK